MARRPKAARGAGTKRPPARSARAAWRPTATGWRGLVIVAVAVLVYASSLSSPFLPDDGPAITSNQTIRDIDAGALSPPRNTPVAGRPLVNLSFALNYPLGRNSAGAYRIVNVLLHALNALLLFGIVRRTLTLPPFSEPPFSEPPFSGTAFSGRFDSTAEPLAWACALIWLLHPLNTEAVIYLSQRTELMVGLFYLATLYCSIRGWHVAAIAACAAGMASKESMVTAPVVVLLYDRVFRYSSFGEAFRIRRPLYIGLAATWLVLGALMASAPRTSVGFAAGSAWTYLLNQAELIVQYLALTFWPQALVWDYGLPRALTLSAVLPEVLFIAGLAAVTIWLLVKRPMAGFLMAWFFITLAPTSSFVPIATEVGAERRMYLPLAGLVVLAVVGIAPVVTRLAKPIGYAAVGLLCALLAYGTVVRSRDYRSLLTLAQTTVDRWPTGRGHFQLASALYDAGRRDEAIGEFKLAAPDFPGARYALGVDLVSRNELDAAAVELEAFLASVPPSHPNAIAARDLLGRIHLSQGRIDQAIASFDEALEFQGYPLRAEVLDLRQQAEAIRRSGTPRR